MDRLLTMRVFQSVADEGGFSAAARKLDMSVPTVTRLVADLEQHLGTRLMQRTTRSVTLTEAGEAYLQRVRGILAEVEDAFSMAQAHTSQLSGLVRVFMPPAFSEHILAPLVADFHQQYPGVSIEVTVDSATEPEPGDYDITFVAAPEGYDANVIARPIISTYGMVCASPDYLMQHGTPMHPKDLEQHRLLLRNYAFSRGEMLRLRHIDNAQAEQVLYGCPLLIANHTGTLLRATLDGAGISVQPLDLIARSLRDGQLVQLLPEWTTAIYTLYATIPSRQFMPARVRALLDFLADNTQRDHRKPLSHDLPPLALKT